MNQLLNALTVVAFTVGGNVYLAQASETPVNMGPLDESLRLTLIENGAIASDCAVNLEKIIVAGGGGCVIPWPTVPVIDQRVEKKGQTEATDTRQSSIPDEHKQKSAEPIYPHAITAE